MPEQGPKSLERPSLGKLIAVHDVSPASQQRAAVVAGLSFLFFLAMMLAFYVRGQFGYFLLSTAFLIVFAFTMIGWWMQRRNVVEVFDRGVAFRKFTAAWEDLAAIERGPEGSITLSKRNNDTVTIPKTIHASDSLEAHIRRNLQ
jgi:hypothetical protein